MKFIAIAAITIDGKIAKHKDHMSDWTSPEDKIFMRALLDKCDVIIVGNNTYKTAVKPLSKRNCIVLSRVLNSPPARGGVRGGGSNNLLYCNPAKTNLKKLVTKLKYKKIAILGGAQTYSFCLENNLIDEIYLTIEPIIFGSGINLFADIPLLAKERLGEVKKFKLTSIKKLNKQGSLLLKYIK